jgi:glutaredoxin
MRILAGAVLLTIACGASAQLYRWTDASGRVHFTDSPPPAGARNVQKKAQSGSQTTAKPQDRAAPAANTRAVSEPYAVQVARKNAPVTLYTGPNCDPCNAARALLNGRSVPFKEVLVRDADTAAELNKAVGGSIVPSIIVGPSRQQGFEEGTYNALLDDAGYPKKGILPAKKQVVEAPPIPNESKAGEPKAKLPVAPKGPYLPR